MNTPGRCGACGDTVLVGGYTLCRDCAISGAKPCGCRPGSDPPQVCPQHAQQRRSYRYLKGH